MLIINFKIKLKKNTKLLQSKNNNKEPHHNIIFQSTNQLNIILNKNKNNNMHHTDHTNP